MITEIGNITLKKKLLTACIHDLELFIAHVKSRIKNLVGEKGPDNDSPNILNNPLLVSVKDKSGSEDMNSDLDFATKEMRVLKYLIKNDEEEHELVELGAIVVTHRNTFFICADLQRINVDNQNYLVISTQSNLFKSMRGKRKGDRFIHNDLSYQILDIY